MNKLLLILFLIFPCALLAQSPNTPTTNALIVPIDSTQKDAVKPPQSKNIDAPTGLNTGYYIADNLSMVKTFSQFYKLMAAAGLTETLRSRGPITIFAPDDNVFAKFSAGKMDTLLMTNNLPNLIALVSYHVIPGKLTLKKIVAQIDKKTQIATFTTLSGRKLYAKYDESHNLVLVDETGHQSVITRDGIMQYNGIFNVINKVLQPKDRLL